MLATIHTLPYLTLTKTLKVLTLTSVLQTSKWVLKKASIMTYSKWLELRIQDQTQVSLLPKPLSFSQKQSPCQTCN